MTGSTISHAPTPGRRATPVTNAPTKRTGWSPTALGVSERMLALTYRLARGIGYSRRASGRLCLAVFRDARTWLDPSSESADGPARHDAGRGIRAGVLTLVRARIEPNADATRLKQAVDTAVYGDELELLPPRQRAALRWAVQQHYTVGQITERTGWTPAQVARLLRAGLITITACGQRSGRDHRD